MTANPLDSQSKTIPIGKILLLPAILFLSRNEPFFKSVLNHPSLHFPTFLDHLLLTPLVLLICAWLAFAIGSFLLQKILKEELPDIGERIVFSMTLGLGTISIVVFILGLLGLLQRTFLIGLAGLTMVLLCKHAANFLHFFSSRYLQLKENRFCVSLNFVESFSAGLILWVVLSGFVLSFAPPTDPDTLAYHFYIPNHYLQQGRIAFELEQAYFYLPLNMEMLYLFGFSLKDETLALLLVWLVNLLLILSIFLFGKNHLQSRTVGYLGAAFFACQPVFTAFLGTAKNDSATALFIFLSIYCLFQIRENASARWLVLSGIFSGLAAGTRYTALPFLLVITALYFLFLLFKKNFSAKNVLSFLVPLFLVASPWYIRNYCWLKNPVWPLFYSLFGGKDLIPEYAKAFTLYQYRSEMESGFFGWLTIVYRLVTKLRFSAYYNPEYLTWPLILTGAGILLQRKKIPRTILLLALFAVLTSYFIFSTDTLWRYYLPAIPALTLILAWCTDALSKGRSMALTLLLLLMVLAVVRLEQKDQLFPAVGVSTPKQENLSPKEGYLQAKLPHYKIYDYIHEQLPENAKILLHGHPDRLYIKRKTVSADPIRQTLIDYQKFKSPQTLLQRVRELGITHILYNESGLSVFSPWHQRNLPAWPMQAMENLAFILSHNANLVMKSENGVSLYELK